MRACVFSCVRPAARLRVFVRRQWRDGIEEICREREGPPVNKPKLREYLESLKRCKVAFYLMAHLDKLVQVQRNIL